MEYVEREHADELPVHRVAWPDWWTDGFGSAARETAASRTTASALNTQEGLLSMARLLGATLPPGFGEELREIKDALLFYDEHTFGAAESISDPMAENTMVQWAQKSSYVWEALKRTGRLNEVSMGFLQPYLPVAETPVITVFNTLNWPRSGVVEVYVDHELLPADRAFHIEDAQGARLPVQRLRSRADGTTWGMQVTDVPGVGYASYRVIRGNSVAESAGKTDFPGTLENRFYRIAFNADGQITSLHDRELNLELLESEPEWKAGQLIYERLSNRAQLEHFKLDHADRTSTAKMTVVEYAEGPVWNSLRLRGDLPGCADARGVEVEIRLHHAGKRVEWLYQMHKLPVTDPEGLYVAFPFGLEAGRLMFEAQGALIEPGTGQLEGTASDWNTVQSVVLARNNRAAIHWCSPEIPLVQLGDINLGQFRYHAKVEKPRLYSWVLNNYWTTNFRASQEGALRWTYTLSSTADRSLTAATRFGWGSRIPLAARVLPPGAPRGALDSKRTLRLEAPNLLLVEQRPHRGWQRRHSAGARTGRPGFGVANGHAGARAQRHGHGGQRPRASARCTVRRCQLQAPDETRLIAEALRTHPDNPRYFTDGTKQSDGALRAVYRTGAHTWNNLVDMGRSDPPEPFDFNAYLDFLEKHHHNFIRLWAWDSTVWDTRANGALGKDFVHHAAPLPWARTGPGNALDGKPKFDLTQFNPDYFDRLRSRVSAAGERGIYVSVMLFEGWGLFHGNRRRGTDDGWAWRNHPFNPANNIDGPKVEGADNLAGRVHTLRNPEVNTLQAAYIRKVVDTLNDLDNVLYEVINEGGEKEWNWWVIQTIHEHQRTKPNQHPVGNTGHGAERIPSMLASPAEWISPGRADGFAEDPPAWNESKVSLLDTDHIWGVGGHAAWVWKSFLRGHNPIFMDPYDGSV
jgi:hypothetical protein